MGKKLVKGPPGRHASTGSTGLGSIAQWLGLGTERGGLSQGGAGGGKGRALQEEGAAWAQAGMTKGEKGRR